MTPNTRLQKMRALLPDAERILSLCKSIDLTLKVEDTTHDVPKTFTRDIRARSGRLAHRLDLMGCPIRAFHASGTPEGTRKVAHASAEAWVALEVACSAVVAVGDLERSLIKSMGAGVPNC